MTRPNDQTAREQMVDEAVRRWVAFRIATRPRWRQLWWWFLAFPGVQLDADDVRDIRALFTYVSERVA